MRATTAFGSATATSVLRSLESTITAGAQLEPAFRVFSPLSLLLSFIGYSNRAISTSSASYFASIAREDLHPTSNNKRITTLPQLSSEMQSAYSSRHYDQVLSLYSEGDDRIIKPASKTDPRSAAMTYDCALKACAAAAEARQAQRILSTMWKRGVPVGRVAQGSVLKALCAAGQRQAAFQHIKGIPAARVTIMHCNTVLSACAAAHDTTIGLKMWEFMKKRGLEMDNVSYCEALRVFGASGDVEKLVSLWENEVITALSSLEASGNFKRYATNIDTATTITASEESLDEEVLVQRKTESKTMVTAAYAGALAAAGHVPLAMAQCELIMDMLGHLLPQELHLSIELEIGRTDDHQLASRNNNKGTTASGGRQTAAPLDNLRSACNAVLHAAVSSHQWHYLRKMVALMTSRGLPPDVITYNALLKAAVKRGEGPQPIHEGVAEMKALGLHPTSATYTLLIEAYATEGDLEGAHTVFNSIKNPDCAAWNAVLRAHAGIGDLSGLGQTFQVMVEQQGDGITDESTYIACFEGIATALRKHTSVMESIDALSGGGSDVEHPAADSGANSGTEAKKIAMDVLHQVEQHMKKNIVKFPSPAMRAALVKAHGALHHTALVWSLLADEYIYKHVFFSSNSTTRKNNRILATPNAPGGSPTPLQVSPGSVHHALPPKPQNGYLKIETELLQALSTATTANKSTNTTANFFAPRALNAGIPQLSRAGRVDLIIQLLKHLPKSGHCPDSETYAALIGACATSPITGQSSHHNQHHQLLKPTLARRLLAHMQEQHERVPSSILLKPCTRVYNALLRAECVRGGVNAALDVIEEMKNKAMQPDSLTWMVLRGCALSNGRNDVADQAMYEIRMLKSGGGSKGSKIMPSTTGGALGPETGAQAEEKHWKGYYASDEEDEW